MNDDRRIKRTRESLQQALLALIQTCSYDAITVQDIAAYANVGRTTFYLHFASKDDLYRSAHQEQVNRIAGEPLTRGEFLAEASPARMMQVYEYHWQQRDVLRVVHFGRDAEIIQRQLRAQRTANLMAHFAAIFPDLTGMPVDVLAHYLVESEMALMAWWLEKRPPYTPAEMAAFYHQLRRAALLAALHA